MHNGMHKNHRHTVRPYAGPVLASPIPIHTQAGPIRDGQVRCTLSGWSHQGRTSEVHSVSTWLDMQGVLPHSLHHKHSWQWHCTSHEFFQGSLTVSKNISGYISLLMLVCCHFGICTRIQLPLHTAIHTAHLSLHNLEDDVSSKNRTGIEMSSTLKQQDRSILVPLVGWPSLQCQISKSKQHFRLVAASSTLCYDEDYNMQYMEKNLSRGIYQHFPGC
jgi:hypothetical protein